MEFTITFIKLFCWFVYLMSPIVFIICMVITSLGLVVGRMESWKRFDAVYWSFITALTVGYGDIRPKTKKSKIYALIIALLGIILTGLLVAVAVEAASISFKMHIKPEVSNIIKNIEQSIK